MENTISYSLECTDVYNLDYFTGRKTIKALAEWLQEDSERSKPSGLQVKKKKYSLQLD